MKFKIILFFLVCLLEMGANPAYAHKVNIFAYREGDTVMVESYFPDGQRVKDGLLEVYDSAGNRLLEGRTDEEGRFNFRLPKRDDLRIVLTTSLGHKSFYILSQEEAPPAETFPLSKTVMGIGFIFALSGILWYFLRRKELENASTRN